MRSSMRVLFGVSLIGLGYFLGNAQIFRSANAQQEETPPSEDAIKKIREANTALKAAAGQLTLESRYSSITKSVNPFAVLVGGINVKDDLENGHGVDPDTFAAINVAIYDLKKNNVKEDTLADWVDTNLFGFDNEGHLTYRNKVLRVYSVSRLRRLNAQRALVLDEGKELKTPK